MKNFWIFVLSFIVAGIVVAMSEKSSDTLKFIDNLQQKLKLTTNPRINLVVGNTGSGKSTLVHYVAGDYSKLVSTKMGRKLKIIDGLDPEINRKTYSTESRTLVPEMVVDEEGYVWYDCPGFGDTHNETVEIAASFLIRKVIENVSNVKIVLVVNYESVTDGGIRNDFDVLLSRVAQLTKNSKPFGNSLSLVVTKVPQYDEFGELLDADDIKNSTVDFIEMHRAYLQKKNVTDKNIQIIDAILKKTSNGDCPRISIFWRPVEAGPFDKSDRMVEGRKKIRDSILQHTSYAEAHENDFGFPLTGEARLKVMDITKNSINSISNILRNIIKDSLNNIQSQVELAADFKKKMGLIKLAKSCIDSPEKAKVEVITFKHLTERLKKLIQSFAMKSIEGDLSRAEQQERNLRTFESLVETESNSDYFLILEGMIDQFSEWEGTLRVNVLNEIKQTNTNITIALADVDRQILEFLQRNVQTIDVFQNRLKWLQLGKDSLVGSITGEFTLRNRQNHFKILIESLNISSININVLNSVDRLYNQLIELKLLSENAILDPIIEWQTNSSMALDYLFSQHNWCFFLQQAYNFFGSYEVQRDVGIYNVANLSNWKNSISHKVFSSIQITSMNSFINFQPNFWISIQPNRIYKN